MNNRVSRKYHPLPIVLILIGLAASAFVLVARYRVESANRSVELAIDFAQLRQLSAAMGPAPAQALGQLGSAGVTGVILSEETLADLESEGALDVRRISLSAADGQHVAVTRVRADDAALYDRIAAVLAHKLRAPAGPAPSEGGLALEGPRGRIFLPAEWNDVRTIGIGLDPQAIALARSARMDVVGRIADFSAASPDAIEWSLGQLADTGARVVIFAGEEVLGYRKQLKVTASALEQSGLLYGAVEMGKQRGDEGLSRALHARFVRVHSIPTAELVRLTPNDAIERFSKAVRERNVRLAYLRLFDEAGAEPMAESLAYVRAISADLRSAGFQMGPAQPFTPMTVPAAAAALAALAVAGAAVLLVAATVPMSGGRQAGSAVLLAVACAGLVFVAGDLGRKVVALGAAVLFPTLGLVLRPLPADDELRREHAGSFSPLSWFALASAISVAGGVVLAGVLSQTASLVKVVEFSGIKVAQHLPLLLVAAIYVTGAFNTGDWPGERRRIVDRTRRFLSAPLLTWTSGAALVGLVVLALLVARSGNDSGVGVSDLELKFRALLDRFLVRPRTKEFLIGHPILWCALFLAAWGRRGPWLIPVVLVGAIGQVGMVNSFCHLHTPIALTLSRTWNGLWVGSFIGLAAVVVLRRLWPPRAEVSPASPVTQGMSEPLPLPRRAVAGRQR
jgi:Family of unknown function (DUF5693)